MASAIVLSYGQLPTKRQFRQQYEKEVGPFDDANFFIELKGGDYDTVEQLPRGDELYDGPRDYDGTEVWNLVRALTRFFDRDDDGENAGSLASSILGILDIEWV